MNTAHQIINEIISEGAKFTLDGDEVGLTQLVSDDLLERARSHKHEIKQILTALKRESIPTKPKVWKLKIRSCEGDRIDGITMIDKFRMTREECGIHLGRQFGKDRIIEYIELTKGVR